jgi:hypothetical protein
MEEVVVGSRVACKELHPMVGILIINVHGEILLHKKQLTTTDLILWETPYLLQHAYEEQPPLTAKRFLDQHGLSGTLHEAFAVTSQQTIRRLIIAIIDTETQHAAINALHHDSLYRPMHEIMSDAQENPNSYSLWLRDSLDGVALYLKNFLKQSTMLMHRQQSEI